MRDEVLEQSACFTQLVARPRQLCDVDDLAVHRRDQPLADRTAQALGRTAARLTDDAATFCIELCSASRARSFAATTACSQQRRESRQRKQPDLERDLQCRRRNVDAIERFQHSHQAIEYFIIRRALGQQIATQAQRRTRCRQTVEISEQSRERTRHARGLQVREIARADRQLDLEQGEAFERSGEASLALARRASQRTEFAVATRQQRDDAVGFAIVDAS